MNLTGVFIARPIATTLLTAAITLAGWVGFTLMPIAPLPQIDFPAINVQVALPGASPETMAAIMVTPLERTVGRIAGLTEMTSSSATGMASLSLLFDLDRDINGAARDVMAALDAARSLLPPALPFNPVYRKINPADAPILVMTMTSPTKPPGEIYDAASTIVAQRLSQVDGVGQVLVGGGSLPAVRVELNAPALQSYGLSVENIRTAISNNNVNIPKGIIENTENRWQVDDNDQAKTAKEYRPLVLAYRHGNPIRLQDIAEVEDSVQDLRTLGLANGQRAILLIVSRQPSANIIETVDRIRAILPRLQASIPTSIDLKVVMDRTPSIRASLHDVERSLVIATVLVILVVFLFLGEVRAALIPSIAIPVSLIGTFGILYLGHYSLDNLSLMALTVATGFVVDDAIVMLENITRHIERGLPPLQAALIGAREVAFTVVSMSVSLVAVFIPLLLMGGMVGRMFREFAVVLSAAVLVSLVVSLTTTPMLCGRWLRPVDPQHRIPSSAWQRRLHWGVRLFERLENGYQRTLDTALHHKRLVLFLLFLTIGLNFYLFSIVPKGFMPQQDTGRLIGRVQADQNISFQAMRDKMTHFIRICKSDPDAQDVIGFTGGEARNAGNVFVVLKPEGERHATSDEVIARLRTRLKAVTGASLYFQPIQDLRFGGRVSNAQYQYTLQGNHLEELRTWSRRIRIALAKLPELADVNSDQQELGLESWLEIDRDTAARLGVDPRSLDQVLNDLYGQRIISTIFNPLNQYRVVMEAAPPYWQSPSMLEQTYIYGTHGDMVPLAAVVKIRPGNDSLTVNHQGQFPATTITFNLPPGVSLGQATDAIHRTFKQLGVPPSIQGSFEGTAKVFKDSLSSEPLLILGALVVVYIVLGILYESLIHPLTILSTLPSAGVGVVVALLITGQEFNLMTLIGIILLIGIVKKNAILMIDFALQAERSEGLSPEEAILKACVKRFRPILMTTLAAMFGALPLALDWGSGGELRRPLGIAILGGLALSQLLTLYTTPVVYLYLDRFRQRWGKRFTWKRIIPANSIASDV
ncbi:MAG: multidrug efflux RND transporter permease subunit [Ferrovum myxofaciens]|uniref:multidrug efflux RND transporter permease subunit n=1 Tax=Ferrovum myxofaciens TaxID=416213 RepID=UPI00235778BA|nr:multidrug efflux RND transporter permease subunit [Ferrovum myxofaciens]QKE40172.1 MAG: multidrug efflux RND transporter permease subunit [Ferrovum myxofaciens]